MLPYMTNGLCRCDSIKNLEMGVVLDSPGGRSVLTRVLIRGRREGQSERCEAEDEVPTLPETNVCGLWTQKGKEQTVP